MPGADTAGTGTALLVIGTNHRTSPAALRNRFALVEAELSSVLEGLRGAALGEAVLIATCDRIELVTTSADGEQAAARFVTLLAERTGFTAPAIAAGLYRHEGMAALRHVFAVASALDGLVLGEPQVLGQVKAAHRLAAEHGLAGGELEVVFSAAFAAARRVRRETRIAERPVSIAAAALQLARDIHGDLDRCAALLLGPGEMGELIADQFGRAGLARLVVCGPPARAERAARRFGCNLLPLDELDEGLAAADIVIASLGSGRAVLAVPRVAAALRRRPRRPIFVIDAAIPADAEPAVNDLDGAFLYDLGDLERTALAGRAVREAASAEARRIIDAELAAFDARRAARRAVPAVVALRRHVEALRRQALEEAGGDAVTATRLLANRLLHDPSEVLRELAGASAGEIAAMEELLRRLFRLRGEDEENTE
ncbi:MAG TPA: glutamyl-tRNA reductase [Stellaceae bacterium]|nr:glutamyl-tRNA reductase [Stellaceae bacterium]